MHVYTPKDVFSDNEFITLRKKKEYNVADHMHSHEFYEIIYTFSGNSVHLVDGVEYPVSRGIMICIPENCTHNIANTSNVSFAEILVRSDVIYEILDEIKKDNNISEESYNEKCEPCIVPKFYGDDCQKAESIIQDMLLEYKYKEINYQNVLLSYLRILMSLSIRNRLSKAQNLKEIPIDVMSYINDHYKKHFKLEDLASKSFYSPKYFSYIFKKSTGHTLTEYVAKKRVDEGCRLLIDTDMTIDEISKELGWENSTQFYNKFKKYCGVTPHAYRKKQR